MRGQVFWLACLFCSSQFQATRISRVNGLDSLKRLLLSSNPATAWQFQGAKGAGERTPTGIVHSYIHSGSKMGVMIEVNCETDSVAQNEKFKEMADNLAIQVVSNPALEYVCLNSIPAEIKEKERRIEAAADDLKGMPDDSAEEIVEGRLEKIFKQRSLYDSPCIWNTDMTVEEYVKEQASIIGEDLKVSRFTRMFVGEESDEDQI